MAPNTCDLLPGDVEIDDLPLWPEALARGSLLEPGKESIHFISDIDEDIEPPVIVTFYSLRGGVGRSTALAYTAHILAARGRKVVCVDMDLEAPGITAIFGKEDEVSPGIGLVHLLMEIDQGKEPNIANHLLRISESYDLYCLPAGKTDANYARLLRYVDPESWYREERNPLHELFDLLCKKLPFTPDVILLDAHTGITQLSGPLMFDLSDISIIVFFPHPQAKTGTQALVKALLAAKTRRKINGQTFTPEIRFLVSPIPSSRAPEVAQRYEKRAFKWISDWLSLKKDDNDFMESDVTHFIPYREVIATSDQVLIEKEYWNDYRPAAEWIEKFLISPGEKEIPTVPAAQKNSILHSFKFSTGIAEHQTDFLETFVETDLVKKALSPETLLVLGRKGTGKTAVFRRLAEDVKIEKIVITSPESLSELYKLLLNADGYKAVEEILNNTGSEWREFWSIYIGLISYYSLLEKGKNPPKPPDNYIAVALDDKPSNQLDLVDLIKKFIQIPQFGLIAGDWLFQLDNFANFNTMLLFDGLDTGFGSSTKERERRNNALEGLLTLLTGSGNRLKNLKFKIMLREDIWMNMKSENKSHFFGRSIQLQWPDQISFLKVAIKHAIRNGLFRGIMAKTNPSPDVDHWNEEEVITAWNLLVGERMSGGKTAYTRNWVWKRFADGNNDHSPRYLLQLLYEAIEWEKKEQERTPYSRSIVRPRSFIAVLPTVSGQALEALRDEEFPELTPLMEALTQIRQTPVIAPLLQPYKDMIKLAIDIGLLCIYEGSKENVERYKVPEIFRFGLQMTRVGQP
ncbi:MAG: AAA family ATPase [Acidobacteria bacterium]|jgi:MinD-like ATPase involved in chromosome partitioning or flagellar assembly|nr:AAA family ATPase [Acidobacteriota bacterium]